MFDWYNSNFGRCKSWKTIDCSCRKFGPSLEWMCLRGVCLRAFLIRLKEIFHRGRERKLENGQRNIWLWPKHTEKNLGPCDPVHLPEIFKPRVLYPPYHSGQKSPPLWQKVQVGANYQRPLQHSRKHMSEWTFPHLSVFHCKQD